MGSRSCEAHSPLYQSIDPGAAVSFHRAAYLVKQQADDTVFDPELSLYDPAAKLWIVCDLDGSPVAEVVDGLVLFLDR